MANRPNKISRDDFMLFCMATYELSSSVQEFHDWYDRYCDLLRVIFWDPEIDTSIAIGNRGRHG